VSTTDVLLVIIAGLLVIIAVALIKSMQRNPIVPLIDDAIERFGQAAQHHAEVNAVLALTQQFQSDPDLLARLPEYSREVVAAALLFRVNTIGNDIKQVQMELSRARASRASSAGSTVMEPHYRGSVENIEQQLEHLLAELAEAHAAVQAAP
jgi:hypothetical protein